MTIQELIQQFNELSAYCDKITTGNLSHKIANLKTALMNIAHLLKIAGIDGWRPASEKPKLKEGEDDVTFIVMVEFSNGTMLPFHATYCKFTGWSHDNVKWWCYPPKE